MTHIIHWIRHSSYENIKIIFYEELVEAPFEKIVEMLMFLNMAIDRYLKPRLDCLKDSPEGKMHRKSQKNVYQFYTSDQRNIVLRRIKQVDDILKERTDKRIPWKNYNIPKKFIKDFNENLYHDCQKHRIDFMPD